jgi:hypothetical protein
MSTPTRQPFGRLKNLPTTIVAALTSCFLQIGIWVIWGISVAKNDWRIDIQILAVIVGMALGNDYLSRKRYRDMRDTWQPHYTPHNERGSNESPVPSPAKH